MRKVSFVAVAVFVLALAGMAWAAPAEKPGESGFTEIPIGEEVQVGPYNVAAVYFQAVDMVPLGKNPSKESSWASTSALRLSLGIMPRMRLWA